MFKLLPEIFQIIFRYLPSLDSSMLAATSNIENNGTSRITKRNIFHKAATFGSLLWLKRAFKVEKSHLYVPVLAEKGRLNCLKYVCEHANNEQSAHSEYAYQFAIIGGHFNCLKYLVDIGYFADWRDLTIIAKYGTVKMADLLFSTIDPNKLLHASACNGNLELLRYIHEKGYTLTEKNLRGAVKRRHLNCLKYIHEHGIKLDGVLCKYAIEADSPACIEYLHKHGCDCDVKVSASVVVDFKAAFHNIQEFKNTHYLCTEAAKSNLFNILKYLHEKGCEWNTLTMKCVIYSSRPRDEILRMVKYMRASECPWDKSIIVAAIDANKFSILKYLCENGCPCDETACCRAARLGNLKMLKYLHTSGYSWDERTCCLPSFDAPHQCFIYAFSNGCPCDPSVLLDFLLIYPNEYKKCRIKRSLL